MVYVSESEFAPKRASKIRAMLINPHRDDKIKTFNKAGARHRMKPDGLILSVDIQYLRTN